MKFETVIGLEIHVQLKTQTKMFCSCVNDADVQVPNTHVCPICMGHPGTLPVTNAKAVEFGIRLALALKSTVANRSKFDRKHYFYPDLPKGYQISQYDEPLATGGFVMVGTGNEKKRFRIERLHLEEDAAKLTHMPDQNRTLVDFNRSGVPLVELVTKPDIADPQSAKEFLYELRSIVRLLGVSDGDMEKGHMRCDANISLRPDSQTLRELQAKGFTESEKTLWPKTEIKNLNSFKAVEDALQYEARRQQQLWEQGKPPLEQSTRGWDDSLGETKEQRTKESLSDYRYLPEPDLPYLVLSETWLQEIQAELPELPSEKRDRFHAQYKLPEKLRDLLVDHSSAADYFEKVASELRAWVITRAGKKEDVDDSVCIPLYETAASWIVTKLFEVLAKERLTIQSMRCNPENFAELILMMKNGKINSNTGTLLLQQMIKDGSDPHELVKAKGLTQLDNVDELGALCDKTIKQFPEVVSSYKQGKTAVLQFLVGNVMKLSGGRANPEVTRKMFETLLR